MQRMKPVGNAASEMGPRPSGGGAYGGGGAQPYLRPAQAPAPMAPYKGPMQEPANAQPWGKPWLLPFWPLPFAPGALPEGEIPTAYIWPTIQEVRDGFVLVRTCSPRLVACGATTNRWAAATASQLGLACGICTSDGTGFLTFEEAAAVSAPIGRLVVFQKTRNITQGERTEYWQRYINPGSTGAQLYPPRAVPWEVPFPYPEPVPYEWPAGVPSPFPGIRTAPAGQPGVTPMEIPKLDPAVVPRGRPGEQPWDGRNPYKPYERPATEYEWPAVDPGHKPVPKPGVKHRDKPDKAKKQRQPVPLAMLAALKLLHTATEVQDFFDAVGKAMPSRCDQKKGLHNKMACVAENWAELTETETFHAAMENLIWNHFEDKVLGALLGSSWRTGVRPYNDQYSTNAWHGAAPPFWMSPLAP